MKFAKYITISLAAAAIAACNPAQPNIELNISASEITCGAAGGVQKIKIGASENWVASTGASWITVSPANGRGSVECEIQIDSALTTETREGIIRIEETALGGESTTLKVTQNGFNYTITLEEPEIEIPSFESLDKRKFDVKVNTNVDFDVVMTDEEGNVLGNWLKVSRKDDADFDKGVRPRNVNVRFAWDISSVPAERVAKVEFKPKDGVVVSDADGLIVRQEAAEKIEIGVRGDALALIGAARALGMWSEWDIAVPMSKWSGVAVWTEDDEKVLKKMFGDQINLDDYIGRVRCAQFYMMKTKEPIPFEVQYLTAAEELRFVGNGNSFLLDDLGPGEYITSLTQLRRLTFMGYGLTKIDNDFKKLENLEALDLSGNNFETIPAVLNQENFPKLHSLILNANQRKVITDLSNTSAKNFGGLYGENPGGSKPDMIGCGIPERLLLWENLDTLKLAVNYLYGEIPDMEDVSGVKRYGDNPEFAGDSLTTEFISMNLPRILPNAKCLTINYNRISGKLPDWLLYHPNLDLWIPYTFIFNQEGTDPNGNKAMFSNEPISLDNYGEGKTSYYAMHPYKKAE